MPLEIPKIPDYFVPRRGVTKMPLEIPKIPDYFVPRRGVTKTPLKIPKIPKVPFLFEEEEEEYSFFEKEEEEIDIEKEIKIQKKKKSKKKKIEWINLYRAHAYKRFLFLNEVTRKDACIIVGLIFKLTVKDYTQPVNLFLVNCLAGRLKSAIAVQEASEGMPTTINTIGCGMTASVGSVVLLSGDKRLAQPNARVLMQRAKYKIKSIAEELFYDPENPESVREIDRVEKYIHNIYVEKTGQSDEVIQQDLHSKLLMSAEEAQDYGIIDEIFTHRSQLQDPEENRVPMGISFDDLFINPERIPDINPEENRDNNPEENRDEMPEKVFMINKNILLSKLEKLLGFVISLYKNILNITKMFNKKK